MAASSCGVVVPILSTYIGKSVTNNQKAIFRNITMYMHIRVHAYKGGFLLPGSVRNNSLTKDIFQRNILFVRAILKLYGKDVLIN